MADLKNVCETVENISDEFSVKNYIVAFGIDCNVGKACLCTTLHFEEIALRKLAEYIMHDSKDVTVLDTPEQVDEFARERACTDEEVLMLMITIDEADDVILHIAYNEDLCSGKFAREYAPEHFEAAAKQDKEIYGIMIREDELHHIYIDLHDFIGLEKQEIRQRMLEHVKESKDELRPLIRMHIDKIKKERT